MAESICGMSLLMLVPTHAVISNVHSPVEFCFATFCIGDLQGGRKGRQLCCPRPVLRLGGLCVCVCVRVNVQCNKNGENGDSWAPVVCVCVCTPLFFSVFKGVE